MNVILIKHHPGWNEPVEDVAIVADIESAKEYAMELKKKYPHAYSGKFTFENIDLINQKNKLIKIPDWCKIGLTVRWNAPELTGAEWVKEKIIGYGYDGFFHQSHNCPMYYSKFSEFGKTIKLEEN